MMIRDRFNNKKTLVTVQVASVFDFDSWVLKLLIQLGFNRFLGCFGTK
jgi:hypothetical protein